MKNNILQIERCEWDSDFFGFPIGKVYVRDALMNLENLILSGSEKFNLIYIFSEKPLKFRHLKTDLTDIKLIFQKKLKNPDHLSEIRFFDKKIDNYDDLLKLAYLSGHLSRFRRDKKFPEGSFEKLYKRWIDKSIEEKSTKIIIEKNDEKIIGFVTVENLSSEKSRIGLIAVDPNFSGQGLGSQLLRKAELLCINSNSKILSVATQKINTAAVKFYKRNKYVISEIIYIYHYWSNKI